MSDEVDAPLVRTSERRTFKECRQKWWWSYVDHLKPVRTAPALRFGTLVHGALAEYYKPGPKRGPHPAGTFERLYQEELEAGKRDFDLYLSEDEEWSGALELGMAMLTHYIEHWGDDDYLEVIAPEMAFNVPVYNDRNGKLLCYAVGTMDAVVRDKRNKRLGFLEHKTAASISFTHLPLDEQAGAYWTFGPKYLRQQKILKKNQDLSFIMYNFLRKALKDDRPTDNQGRHLNQPTKAALLARAEELGLVLPKKTIETLTDAIWATGEDPALLGEVSKSQPPAYFERKNVFRDEADRHAVEFRVKSEAWEMQKIRRGELPVYKNPSGSWPDQHCNSCEFREMCELHETGSNWEDLRDMTMGTWNPYADHGEEKSA